MKVIHVANTRYAYLVEVMLPVAGSEETAHVKTAFVCSSYAGARASIDILIQEDVGYSDCFFQREYIRGMPEVIGYIRNSDETVFDMVSIKQTNLLSYKDIRKTLDAIQRRKKKAS